MILFAFPPSGVWRIFLLWGRGEHHPARDLNSHLKGFLTSLASMLHCTKKSLTMVSFSFFFPCLLPFLQLPLSKLWRNMLHPFHFLLLPLPFIAVFCIEEAWFFPRLIWDICLFNKSLRDIINVIQVSSAWAQGLSSVSILSTSVCWSPHFYVKRHPATFFSSLILIWHCSGNGRCKYMR